MHRIILCWLISLLSLTAHEWEQMYFKIKVDDKKWEANIKFDAAYAVPEIRDEPSALQPERQWLIDKSEEEHAAMRKEAERYLREFISMHYLNEGKLTPLKTTFKFPDWDELPPIFPKLLDGKAYFNLSFGGTLPDHSGALVMKLANGKYPKIFYEINNTEIKPDVYNPGDMITLANRVVKSPSGESQELKVTTEVQDSSYISHLWNKFVFGFEHVLPLGLDHILFIIAMCLLLMQPKALIHQSILFTLAHSVTLGLVAAGVVIIGDWYSILIEVIIALSIAVLAIENLFRKKLQKQRVILIFAFGLIHGMGFAGVLGEGLAASSYFWSSLIMANIGIEIAQILIIIICFLIFSNIKNEHTNKIARQAVSILIASIALYWTIERSISLMG